MPQKMLQKSYKSPMEKPENLLRFSIVFREYRKGDLYNIFDGLQGRLKNRP